MPKSPQAFRTIREVADWLGVAAHVLRFWESKFSQIKPVKRAGGRRYYRPSDMQLVGGIKVLLHEQGMTIRGVQNLLQSEGVAHVSALSPPIDAPFETARSDARDNLWTEDEAPATEPPRSRRNLTLIEDAETVEEDVAQAQDAEADEPAVTEPAAEAPAADEPAANEPAPAEPAPAGTAEAPVFRREERPAEAESAPSRIPPDRPRSRPISESLARLSTRAETGVDPALLAALPRLRALRDRMAGGRPGA